MLERLDKRPGIGSEVAFGILHRTSRVSVSRQEHASVELARQRRDASPRPFVREVDSERLHVAQPLPCDEVNEIH